MITLYHVEGSRSLRTLWLLNELELEFSVNVMPLDLKHLRAPEYLAINPLGRVPALVDHGVTLFESGAICEYLCEKHSPNELGRPIGHAERPEWLQWVHYAETLAFHGAALLQQQVFIAPDDRSEPLQNIEKLRLGKGLEMLDQQLQNQDYLLASGFSAADINVGYSVYLGQGFVSLEPYPNTQAYFERLSQRPAFIKSKPGEEWQA